MSVPLDVWSCWRSEWGKELRGMGSSETLTAVQAIGVCFRARGVERGRRMSVWSAAGRSRRAAAWSDSCIRCDARCARVSAIAKLCGTTGICVMSHVKNHGQSAECGEMVLPISSICA